MVLGVKDLKHNNSGEDYEVGYRIVYFYNDTYKVGEYCKSIEGFMIGFAECYPILDDNDIPNFIFNIDLLSRYLKDMKNTNGVAIYNVNGTCIDKLYREDTKYFSK